MISSEKIDIPIVSIVCDVYNHGPYLRQCLEGFMMQQTSFQFEVLIHDDASTDDSAEVIREYEKKYPHVIKPIYQSENQYSQGISIWQTYQFSRAQGKYIALCEGDDYWTDPLKLQKQVDFLEAHPDYGMCYTRARYFLQTSGRYQSDFGRDVKSFEELIVNNTIPTLTTIFRKELQQQYQKEIEPQKRSWKLGDWPLWLYIAHESKLHFMDETTAVYRVLDNSASHSLSIEKRIAFLDSCYATGHFFAEKYSPTSLVRLDECSVASKFEEACLHKSRKYQQQYYRIAVELNRLHPTVKLRLLVTLGRIPALYCWAINAFRSIRKLN
ncbi:MAG: glycosyltransferase [Muribaculaceae bacterium]